MKCRLSISSLTWTPFSQNPLGRPQRPTHYIHLGDNQSNNQDDYQPCLCHQHTLVSRMYTLLRQCRMCWLGHVCQVDDSDSKWTAGHPKMCYRDICKLDHEGPSDQHWVLWRPLSQWPKVVNHIEDHLKSVESSRRQACPKKGMVLSRRAMITTLALILSIMTL